MDSRLRGNDNGVTLTCCVIPAKAGIHLQTSDRTGRLQAHGYKFNNIGPKTNRDQRLTYFPSNPLGLTKSTSSRTTKATTSL